MKPLALYLIAACAVWLCWQSWRLAVAVERGVAVDAVAYRALEREKAEGDMMFAKYHKMTEKYIKELEAGQKRK